MQTHLTGVHAAPLQKHNTQIPTLPCRTANYAKPHDVHACSTHPDKWPCVPADTDRKALRVQGTDRYQPAAALFQQHAGTQHARDRMQQLLSRPTSTHHALASLEQAGPTWHKQRRRQTTGSRRAEATPSVTACVVAAGRLGTR